MREGCLAGYEGGAQLLVHLQSLEVSTFEPLLSPQTSHRTFLFARFQASPEPQRCRFIVLKSQNISIPDWHTIDMSQAILRLR